MNDDNGNMRCPTCGSTDVECIDTAKRHAHPVEAP